MFRAAFPSAPDDLERTESNWVKQNFDSKGANGGSEASGGRPDTLRLAGVWVRPEVAKTLAPDYSLESIIGPLLSAKPDPSQEYRRSTKQSAAAQQANGAAAAAAGGVAGIVSSSPVKPTSPPGSPKPKRRKEASMTATVAATGTSTTTTIPSTASAVASPKKGSATTTETLGLPTPRRSTRTTSPAPVPAPVTPATRGTRSKGAKGAAAKPVKEQPSARLATPEEEDEGEGEEAEVQGPNMSDDIAEQKELIAKLKAERSKKEKDGAPSAVPLDKSESSKRAREEDDEGRKPLKFQFREHGSEEDENAVSRRPIRSNRRISFVDMEPQQKSAAWGALWFAAGLAAA